MVDHWLDDVNSTTHIPAGQTFVIDHSILIMWPDAINRLGKNSIVMTIDTVASLDRISIGSGQAAENARSALQSIEAVGKNSQLSRGVKLVSGGVLYILIKKFNEYLPRGMPEEYTKKLSFGAACALTSAGADVAFLSRNMADRLVSEALGIRSLHIFEGADLNSIADNPSLPAGNTVSVFISYNSGDRTRALSFSRELKARGYDVWLDRESIKYGESIPERVFDGIESSKYVLALLTPKSVESKWVKRELQIAINHEIDSGSVKIIPVLLENCSVPTFLADKKYADFRNSDDFTSQIDELCKSLTS